MDRQYVPMPALFGVTRRAAARGVTLIELMVGLVIGLVATLIVAQVLEVAETQKRAATSGNDAQVNGALALYQMQRELQMAGYGLMVNRNLLGCPTHARFRGGAEVVMPLTPLTITDGANGAPDTITVMYGVKSNAALPTRVVKDHGRTETDFAVQSPVGFRVGDVLIAVPQTIDVDNWCSVLNVTAVSSVAGEHVVSHVSGPAGPWNPDPASSVFPVAGYRVNSYLINIGQVVQRIYSISAAQVLQESTGGTQAGGAMGAPVDLFPGIVNLQALYGKDTNNDGVVDRYDSVTPNTPALWGQVLVLRVAVVARSSQFEKEEVTVAQPQWDVGGDENTQVEGARTCGPSRCIELKVDGDPNWKHHRYKVYEAVVPLRNVLWSPWSS